jgi:hypothetical protein
VYDNQGRAAARASTGVSRFLKTVCHTCQMDTCLISAVSRPCCILPVYAPAQTMCPTCCCHDRPRPRRRCACSRSASAQRSSQSWRPSWHERGANLRETQIPRGVTVA